MTKALDILDRSKAAFQRQAAMHQLWQECADIYLPTKASFTATTPEGQESAAEIYDTIPRQAANGLAKAIDGLLKPSTTNWFWMRTPDEELNERDEVKRYFDAVRDVMWRVIYDPRALFVPQSNAVDADIPVFGLGYLWIGERKNRDGLMFRSLFIGDVAIGESADGQIDRADIRRCFTARQARQEWGEDKLGPKVLEALRDTKPDARDKKFTFVQSVFPNTDRDIRYRTNTNLPFKSCIVCEEDEILVEESGFGEFPMAIPRWDVPPGQLYPRSPGMMALPDARTLQAMGRTLLIAGEKAADPPIWVTDDGMLSPARTWPGGLSVVSMDSVKETGGRPMGVLEAGKNMPIGLEMQDAYRRQVEAAFLKNILGLPAEGPDMTATEIVERKEEYIRMVGPVIGQLQPGYPGMIVPRVYGILARLSYVQDGRDAGRRLPGAPLPEIPDALKGQVADFEYLSPIQKAMKQREAIGMGQMMQVAAPIFQMQPRTMAHIDGDKIVRDLPEAFGASQKWLRPLDQVQAEQEKLQAVQEAAVGLGEAEQGAVIAEKVASAGQKAAQAQNQQAA